MGANAYLNFYYNSKAKMELSHESPLTFTSNYDGDNRFVIRIYRYSPSLSFNYSTDNGMTWEYIYIPAIADNTESEGYIITTLSKGQSVMLIGDNQLNNIATTYMTMGFIDGPFSVSGNLYSIMTSTLYNTVTTLSNIRCFKGVFSNQTYLEDASNLILRASTLSYHAYDSMFYGCTSLKYPPALPATTLAEGCYAYMFYGCTSLLQAPELPATTLSSACYNYMFNNCTSLKAAPELPATTLQPMCYTGMFGTCTSLLSAPSLPATTMTFQGYAYMFYGCTSLCAAPALPATTLAEGCYVYMFYGCTSLTTAPVLPALSLPRSCYEYMFAYCENIHYIKCLAQFFVADETDQLNNWVSNVANTGTFVKNPDTTWWILDSDDGIPIGWTLADDGSETSSGYAISLTVSPSDGGTVYGGGYYASGQSCTLSAVPVTGNIFDGWYIGNTLLSHDANYTFNVASSLSITAKFAEDTTVYHQILISYGTSLPSTTYIDQTFNFYASVEDGDDVSIDAPSRTGMTYEGWYYSLKTNGYWGSWSEINTSTDIDYNDLTSDIAIFMLYSINQDTSTNTLRIFVSPPEAGSFSLNNSYTIQGNYYISTYTTGSTATITANPNTSYQFDYWQLNGIEYSTNSQISITMSQDHTLGVMFEDAPVDYSHEYFTITAEEDLCGVWINVYKNENFELQYSYNNGAWTSLGYVRTDNNDNKKQIFIRTLQKYDTLRLRAVRGIYENFNEPWYGSSSSDVKRFSINKKYTISGNLQSMHWWSYDDGCTDTNYTGNMYKPAPDYIYSFWFYEDTNLTDAKNLYIGGHAAGNYCFNYMFMGCTKMKHTPSFNVYDMGIGCMAEMFRDCTSITAAPALPMTALSKQCYLDMFFGCSSIITIPTGMLPAIILQDECYRGMFSGCTSIVSVPSGLLPATIIKYACYSEMFLGCSSLNDAPLLPATTLAESCYEAMFAVCTSLNFAPVLPATTLVDYCYRNMFTGCNNLCYIKVLATGTDFSDQTYTLEDCALYNWANNVASRGYFIKDANMTYTIDSPHGVPFGWTIYTAGAPDEPEPTIAVDADLMTEKSFNSTSTMPWYGTDSGASFDMTADGIRYINPVDNTFWKDELWLIHDTSHQFEEGHNYMVTMRVKYIGDDSTPKMYVITGQYESGTDPEHIYDKRIYQNANIISHGDNFFDIAFRYPDYPVDTDYCDVFLQLGELVGTLYIKDVKLYEYGMDEDAEYNVNCEYNLEMGEVSGTGRYTYGSACTLTATANTGYKFVRWEQNNTIIGTNSAYSFYVMQDTYITAVFEVDDTESDNYANRYLTIEAVDDGIQVAFGSGFTKSWSEYYDDRTVIKHYEYVSPAFDLYWSVKRSGDEHYSEWYKTTISQGIRYEDWTNICILYAGDKLRMHGTATTLIGTSPQGYVTNRRFNIYNIGSTSLKSRFKLYGNIMSLMDADAMLSNNYNYNHPTIPVFTNTTLENGQFKDFFRRTYVTDASNLVLPSMTLTEECYAYMFDECKSLTSTPALPATTLAKSCYSHMFYWCSNILSGPSLPATTMAEACYGNMFSNCIFLRSTPTLPATTLAKKCYAAMFHGCNSLISVTSLPATTLAEGCYAGMFYGCTSLTTAPVLPAATLVDTCYEDMFMGCDLLSSITCLATDVSASGCTLSWVVGVNTNGTFTKETGMSSWPSGANGIPTGWNVVDYTI